MQVFAIWAIYILFFFLNQTPAQTTNWADFNNNGKVEFSDFLLFVAAYDTEQPRYDFDGSGKVDFPDFIAFVQAFSPASASKQYRFDLATVLNGNGSGHIDTITATANGMYDVGKTITAQTTVDYASKFSGWYNAIRGGTLISTENPYIFNLSTDIALYARFERKEPYDLNRETYTIETLWETSNAHRNLNEGTRIMTMLATHKGYMYVVYVTTDRQVKIAKISIATGQAEETFLKDLDGNIYVSRDDGHHRFSLGVDKTGFIHIAGDMHNYPLFNNRDHMPLNMRDGNVNYWRSDKAEDISSFTWLGKNGASAPRGRGHTYMAFTYDMNGELYYYSRVADDAIAWGSYRAFLVSRYDTNTQTWAAIGGINDFQNLCTIWEDNGENDSRYSKIHGWVAFGRNNRMHITAPILNANLVTPKDTHYSTHITYLTSDNRGTTLRRVSGDTVTAPVRVDTGTNYDTADIVFENPKGLQTFSSVAPDVWGNPIVLALDSTNKTVNFMAYNIDNVEWINLGSAGIDYGNDIAIHSDRSGVITAVRDGKSLTRMWRPDGQIRHITSDGSWRTLTLDRKHLLETGDILAIPARFNDTQTFKIIRFSINRPIDYPTN